MNKPCIKCGSRERYSDGACKPCARKTNAMYYSSNRAKKAESNKKWYELNIKKHLSIAKKYQKVNSEKIRLKKSEWSKTNLEKRAASAAKRKAIKLRATVEWGNQFFIEEIYDLAQRRTKATGFKWQVDHKVPLQSKLVCGLHVENNLQVIPAIHNISKSNRHWENMP